MDRVLEVGRAEGVELVVVSPDPLQDPAARLASEGVAVGWDPEGVVALQLRVVDLPALLRFDADGRLIEVRAPLAPDALVAEDCAAVDAEGAGLRTERDRDLVSRLTFAWRGWRGPGSRIFVAALGRRLRQNRAAWGPRERVAEALDGPLAEAASGRLARSRGFVPRGGAPRIHASGRSWQRACEIPATSGRRGASRGSAATAPPRPGDRTGSARPARARRSRRDTGGGRGPSGRAAARRRPLDAGRGRHGWPRGSRDPVVARDRDLSRKTGGLRWTRGQGASRSAAGSSSLRMRQSRSARCVAPSRCPSSCSPRCASASGRASGGGGGRGLRWTRRRHRRSRSLPPSRGRPRQVQGDARPRGRADRGCRRRRAAGPAARGRPRRPLVVAARP